MTAAVPISPGRDVAEIGVDHGEVGVEARADGAGHVAEAVDPRAA
jgi:hypothetical protein